MTELARIERVHVYPANMSGWVQQGMPDREVVGLEDADAFDRVAGDVEVLVAGSSPTRDWSAASRLRLLHAIGAGVENLLPAEGLRDDVQIANASGVHLPAMSEWAVTALLAARRQFDVLFQQQQERRWRPIWRVHPLAGARVCILGLGNIGADVARLLEPFGPVVVGTKRRPGPVDGVAEVLGADDTAAAMSGADAVVVALPLTPATRREVGAAELDRLNEGSVLIDVSRGGVVDTEAVVAALGSGRLRAAVIDVWDEEPLPEDSPYWDVPGLIVGPHTSGASADYLTAAAARIAENVDRLERGEPLLSPVDRNAGY